MSLTFPLSLSYRFIFIFNSSYIYLVYIVQEHNYNCILKEPFSLYTPFCCTTSRCNRVPSARVVYKRLQLILPRSGTRLQPRLLTGKTTITQSRRSPMAESKASRDAFARIHFASNAHFAAALFPIIRIRAYERRTNVYFPRRDLRRGFARHPLSLFTFLSFQVPLRAKFYITHRLEISLPLQCFQRRKQAPLAA